VRIHRVHCQLANSRKIQKELQTFSNWPLLSQLTWLSPASRWAMILSLTKRLSQLSQSKILQLVSLKSLCTTSWHILAISIYWEQRRKTRVAKIQTNDAKRATQALKVAAKTVSKRHKRCLKLSSKTLRWWLSYKLSFINSSTKLAIWPMLKLRSLSWNNPSKHINRVRPIAKILTQDHLPHPLKVASKLKILAQFLANKSSRKVYQLNLKQLSSCSKLAQTSFLQLLIRRVRRLSSKILSHRETLDLPRSSKPRRMRKTHQVFSHKKHQ